MATESPRIGDVDPRIVQLVEEVHAGNRLRLPRALTLVEDGGEMGRYIVDSLYPFTGRAHTIGITGSQGVGKSTLIARLAKEFSDRDKSVGILAVDPTSLFTGGAFLGDRIVMQSLFQDPKVTIRSMASRGNSGGVAATTQDLMSVMDAFGKNVIIVETVGAGQDDVGVNYIVDSRVVIDIPGMGGDIQSWKAGILEIADIFVVNKADLPGANVVKNRLTEIRRKEKDWEVPIIPTVARTGEGIVSLVDLLEKHWNMLTVSGKLAEARQKQVKDRILSRFKAEVGERIKEFVQGSSLDELAELVFRGEMLPGQAVAALIEQMRSNMGNISPKSQLH